MGDNREGYPLFMEVIMAKQKNKTIVLTEKQIKVIRQTHDILNDVLDNIYDLQDINLSQIKQLSEIYYELKYEFNLYEEK